MRTIFEGKQVTPREFDPDDVLRRRGPRSISEEHAQGQDRQSAGGIDPATVEHERQKAYEQGRAEGRAERDQAIEQAVQQAMQQARAVAEVRDEVRRQAEVDVERFVRSVVRGVLPSIADRAAGLELQNAINEVIRTAQPRSYVTVSLHPAVARAIEPYIDVGDAAVGVSVEADPHLNRREASVTWQDGGASVDFGHLLERCLKILDGAPVIEDGDAAVESAEGRKAQSEDAQNSHQPDTPGETGASITQTTQNQDGQE